MMHNNLQGHSHSCADLVKLQGSEKQRVCGVTEAYLWAAQGLADTKVSALGHM